ncbi:hypothetical protein EYF80_050676 [Liparis tanakae]|uniref:Uncharacterized protein n=1 Tax=Liparis tanakae TaxID=230148 RepID=A0A4Z2FD76_9TELE|nr:hypothetical protein EYF80_050676 [Liparis tanakae]
MAVLVIIWLPAATHRSPTWYARGQRRQRINRPANQRARDPGLDTRPSRGASGTPTHEEPPSRRFASSLRGEAETETYISHRHTRPTVVAAQAGVERAAEALVVEHREGVEADARLVVKLSALWDVAAPRGAVRLLAGGWSSPGLGGSSPVLHS